MILVDTSVWIDHLRRGNSRLASLLADGQVSCHGYVIGELSLGRLQDRATILGYLSHLPLAPIAEHDEVLELVDHHRLMGVGIGWVDAHLLASSLLGRLPLWTLDQTLGKQARRLGVAMTQT